jgi:hypothetical protein
VKPSCYGVTPRFSGRPGRLDSVLCASVHPPVEKSKGFFHVAFTLADCICVAEGDSATGVVNHCSVAAEGDYAAIMQGWQRYTS